MNTKQLTDSIWGTHIFPLGLNIKHERNKKKKSKMDLKNHGIMYETLMWGWTNSQTHYMSSTKKIGY